MLISVSVLLGNVLCMILVIFKLVETLCCGQNSLCLVNTLSPVGKNVYSVFVEWTYKYHLGQVS